MKKVLGEIAYRIKRNPVLIATAALWAQTALSTGSPITLRAAIYVVTGFLVRSKVVPANETALVSDLLDHISGAVKDANAAAAVAADPAK